jgi:hypothetical protein
MTCVLKIKDLLKEHLEARDDGFYKAGKRVYFNTGYVKAPYGCNEDTILLLPPDLKPYEPFLSSSSSTDLNVRYTSGSGLAIFDQTGEKAVDLIEQLSQPFTAAFLLEPVRYNGRIDLWVKQIRVKSIQDLPEGCRIES